MSTAAYWWKLAGLPALVLLAVYVVAVVAARFAVGPMLYYPNFASRRAPAKMEKIRSGADEIAVLHLPNPTARFTVWFFHGNAEDLGDLEPFLALLHDHGFAVLAWDYPGYGHSSGHPSEASLYRAARAVRAHLRDNLQVPAGRTLIYGRSLGTGPAVQMAMEETPAGVMLQAPFVSVYRVMTRWPLLPFSPFRNLRKTPALKSPLLVMHGRQDEVIAFWHGEAIHAAARGPKRTLWVEGGHHNDMIDVAGPAYWTALADFSELCARGAAARP